ncbi:MAG: LysM peptidoglycan-binding domain-containing protein [Polyangiaceae bacterium]|nr:LysM peptidoglycan-binding domain-containing protein [Polyangiaceae bacterium]
MFDSCRLKSPAGAPARCGRVRRLALTLAASGLLWGQTSLGAEAVHEVARGESLWSIAHAKGISVEALRARNQLEGDAIRAGDKLVIPGKNYKPPKQRKAADTAQSSRTDASAKTDSDTGSDPAPAPAVVFPKPPSWTQVQKTPKERGGINPCLVPDPGFGIYDPWQRGISMGQLIMPGRGGITKSGAFDLMIHFHGHEPARKEWVRVMDGAVLVGIDLGIGSGAYSSAFSSPVTFPQLIQSVEQAVAKKTGNAKAHVRRVGLSSWSAGYGAVQEIINQSEGRRLVDSVILLDGLHCGYQGPRLDPVLIRPFIEWARLAARGERFMFVSHSSIIPPGYSSTTETAELLVHEVGGRLRVAPSRRRGPMGLESVSRYSRRSLHVRGFSGNGPMDHCAQIGLYRDVLKVHIKPRWNSPRGRRGRSRAVEPPRVAAKSPARAAPVGPSVQPPRAPVPPKPPVVPAPEPKAAESEPSTAESAQASAAAEATLAAGR